MTSDNPYSERHYEALREYESAEAQFNARLAARQQEPERIRTYQLERVAALEAAYKRHLAQQQQKRAKAELDLEMAHAAASAHCAEIGVQYVPDVTTEEAIYAVPPLGEAEAAQRRNLPFGVGYHDAFAKACKPVLMGLCWVLSALSIGLGNHLLNPKNLLDNPVNVGLSLAAGGVVALGTSAALAWLWKAVGTMVGSGRPAAEVARAAGAALAVTLLLLAGLAYLDAKPTLLLNARRAALNPVFQVPLPLALLLGLLISGTYVLSTAGSAFADSYTQAARMSIEAEIRREESRRREARQGDVPVRKALGALSSVKVREQARRAAVAELQRLETTLQAERARLLDALPPLPTALEPDEIAHLAYLRERIRAAKTDCDAYTESRDGLFPLDAETGKE